MTELEDKIDMILRHNTQLLNNLGSAEKYELEIRKLK